jgi:PPP family 3-phenylpropionic acid transporter
MQSPAVERIGGLPPFARFAGLYAALYGGFGTLSPFLPELLQQHGFNATEIGSTVAIGTLVRIVVGPAAGDVADRYQAWRAVFCGCAAAAGLAVLLYLPTYRVWALVLVTIVHASALAPLPPLADAMAVSASHRPQGGFAYGWVRGTGSAAFVAGVIAGGHAASWLGPDTIVWANAAMLAVAAAATLSVPNILPRGIHPPSEPGPDAIRTLLRSAPFRRLLLVAALILGSHALHDTFAVIHWQAAGIDSGTASLLWSESVLSEVLVFFVLGPALLDKLGPSGAVALAAAAGVLRWSILGASTEVAAVALAEPLHGFTFALLHLAAMELIAAIAPARVMATAQAIYGTVAVGAATAFMAFASGPLYAWNAKGAFWLMALLCALAMPLSLGLHRHTAPSHGTS